MTSRSAVTALLGAAALAIVWRPGWAESPSAARRVPGADRKLGGLVATSTVPAGVGLPAAPRRWGTPGRSIWAQQRTPAPGAARIFGRTTCGCIAGATPLPVSGEGFLRRYPWRRSYFGHPDLVDYIERLGRRVRAAGLGTLVVGEMSLPRGGAYQHGHFSHQTGLDVDIAYATLGHGGRPRLVANMRHGFHPGFVAPEDSQRMERMLRLAAADPRVDRIFVSGAIKQHMCATTAGDHVFLDVLRPWWGHENHFHVRLKCPADSPACRPNEPVTSIADDCRARASWWEGREALTEFARWRVSLRSSCPHDLPAACGAVLETPGEPPMVVSTERPPRPAHGRVSAYHR